MSTQDVYKELPSGYFRLLKIDSPEETLSCTTKDFPLNSTPTCLTPEYDAVSYCWGKADLTATISCNGVSFKVTSHLYDALRHLHLYRPHPPRWLWVDGVCINQNNYREKEVQVQLMARIYCQAQRTVAWLGLSENNSDIVMDNIASLSNKLALIGHPVPVEKLPLYGLMTKDDPIWRALGHFFGRAWFDRLWIIQEAALSANIVVLCGSKSVDWRALTLFYEVVQKTALQQLFLGEYDVRTYRSDGFFAISLIIRAKQILKQWGFYVLLPILCEGRSKKCTEPVDRIWGFLGLIHSGIRDDIEGSGFVDYSPDSKRRYYQTYINFGKWYIQKHDPNLQLLSLASSVVKHPDIPSWCPDWTSTQEYNSFVAISSYRAGYTVIKHQESHTRILPGSNNIRIPGFQVDIVGQVAEMFWTFSQLMDHVVGPHGKAAQLLEWESECLKISQQIYSQPDRVPEAHWRTLIGDRIAMQRCTQDLSGDYQTWKNDLVAKKNNRDEPLSASKLATMSTYSSAVHTACKGRRYFGTRRGRIGLGPTELRSGDVVCVFYSGSPLYILRFEPGSVIARLVGDAYVHGLMSGEALSLENREPDQDFIIG